MPEWIGQTIGKVRIEKYLARGGMAEVYLGTHLTLDRPVAVKVMHSYIESDPDLQSRFQREAKVVAALRHSNIVQVYDFDTYQGHPYIVMEHIKGPTFAAYLRALHDRNEIIPLAQTARILYALTSAIDYAHSLDVIHRDIKPANILLHGKKSEFTLDAPLTNDVEPIITDFGLVRLANSATQTASGFISGTPAYMSPEQARGDKVDHRTDIYSLGCVLYEMLAGRVPFEGDSTMAVMYKHINEPPPPIEGISPELQAVIDHTLTKNPEDRYQSGRELLVAFYSAVGMKAEMDTILRTAMPRTPSPISVSKQQKQKTNPLLIGAGVFACICLLAIVTGVAGFSALSIFSNKTSSPTQQAGAYPEMTMPSNPADTSDTSVGVLRFQDGSAFLDKVTISAAIPAPPEGKQYEAWLVDSTGEVTRSVGVLQPDNTGQLTLTYVDSQSRNLLAVFDHMEITLEPNPDDSPNSSNDVAYSSGIPAGSLEHIRHLLVFYDATPNNTPIVQGLRNDTTIVNDAAQALLNAYEAKDEKTVRAKAEIIINVIVGKQAGDLYKDWDGNGTIDDPGDGYGLLRNGDQEGYVEGAHHHSTSSAKANGATPNIKLHAGHVDISAQNLEDWTPQLRDLAIRIAQTPLNQETEADIRIATTLANQMLNGIDINGNELIDPIPGEGGAITAYNHAYYMADMPILPGQDQIPPPAK